MPLRFPRSHHLKRQRLIRPLFDRSVSGTSSVPSGSIRLVYRVVSREEAGRGAPVRAGFAVPKRLGPAVMRNRLKRVLRETWRQHPLVVQSDPDRVLTVMVIVRSVARDREAIRQDLIHAIDRLDAFQSLPSSEREFRG